MGRLYALLFVGVMCFAVRAWAGGDDGVGVIYSKAFYGDSSGDYLSTSCSLTNNCDVQMNGRDAVPILVNPWESVPIEIVCEQVAVIPQGGVLGPSDYAFAGNSVDPDVVVWGLAREGNISAKQCFPSGTAMVFPAAGGGGANGAGQNNFALPHLDVHVMSLDADRVPFQAYLIVWYLKDGGP